MGWDSRSLTITARVSSHNSPQDDADEARWAELEAAVREIVGRFEDIGADAF